MGPVEVVGLAIVTFGFGVAALIENEKVFLLVFYPHTMHFLVIFSIYIAISECIDRSTPIHLFLG